MAGEGSVTEPPTDPALSHKHDAPTEELQTLLFPLRDSGTQQITNQEAPKPVALFRRMPVAPPRTSLNLAPMAQAHTPVEILEEGAGDGGKGEREEEKAKASLVDGSSSFYQSQIALLSSIAPDPTIEEGKGKPLDNEPVKVENKYT